MTEIYNCTSGVDKPIPVLEDIGTLIEPIEFQECSLVIIKDDISIGTAIAPIAVDEPLITVGRDATVIVDGSLDLYRDVDAAEPLVLVDSSAKLIVTGAMNIVRDGIGAGGVFRVAVDSLLKVMGVLDLLSFEGVATANGSFLFLDRDAKAWFNQILFNSGGDLAMGAFATIWADRGACLHVVDLDGPSDALNTTNPGGAACTGIMLTGGAKAFLPPWQTNTGIGAAAAPANGRDVKVGGAAVADWAGGGSEVLTDLAAGAPELCLCYKP